MQIDVKLDKLHSFAERLADLQNAIRLQRAKMSNDADEIRQYWSDSTYDSHRRFLGELLAEIEGFEGACENHVDFLHRKYQAGLNVLRG